MIQVTLDLSMLTKKPAASLCQLALTFAGCSWKDDVVDLPEAWDGTEFQPWRWDKPTHLRVFFIDDTNAVIEAAGFVDIPITPFDATRYVTDIERLKKDYSNSLQKRIFKDGKLQQHEVRWAVANRMVELNDNVAATVTNTGFLTASIGQFAQKLPPLNMGLNLVFYAEKTDFNPAAASAGIIAFPIAGAGTKWEPQSNFPAVQAGSVKAYGYKTNGGAEMVAYCEVTKWPEGQNDKLPVKLRDTDGNFDGHVELSVNDVEDWVPGFLTRVGGLFDHPALFLDYLQANVEQLKWDGTTSPDQHKKLIGSLGDFLFSVLRDTVNTGYREGAYGESILRLAVKQFCDESFGEEHTLSAEAKLKYWATYANEYAELKDELSKAENRTTVQGWKDLLKQIEFNADGEQHFKDAIAGLSFNTNAADINGEIQGWISRWQSFIELLSDNGLVAAIIAAEWKIAAIHEKWQAIVKKILLQITHELRLQQKEVLSDHYKEKIFAPADASADEIEKIKANSVEAVKKYLDDRINTNPLQFMPKAADPFNATPVPISLTWQGFLTHAGTFLKTQVDQESGKLFPDEKKTYDIPPALRVTVDAFGAKGMFADDLNDEISGHIVLMQRSKAPRETTYDKEWRCLNRVLITQPATATSPFYFVPAFLPETGGVKTPYLEINNEKLSLIAGHQTYADANHGEADELVNVNTQYYWFDERHKGYALWYGYNYRFAGFVALNSGVLPKLLRNKEADWNIPADKFAANAAFKFKEHQHFRRVPVSKMRVEPKYKGGNTQEIPKGLLPLAFELKEWKDNARNDAETTDKNSASHYLLAKGANYRQEEVVLNLRKPTTSFWNWYAWLGADAATVKPGGTSSYAQLALEMELEARDASVTGTAIQKQVRLCDPAVHRLVTVMIERKFPTTAGLNVKEFDIDMGASDWLGDPEKQLTITLGTATTVDVAQAKITVADGEIVRIKIHTQISKSYFNTTGKDQKFHEWMREQLIAKNTDGVFEERGDYYLANPVDMWFEAAKKPEVQISADKPTSKELWDSLAPVQLADKVLLKINKQPGNYKYFAYLSRLEVKHQLWNWNGRLDESNDFLTKQAELDPEDGKTTPAMEWEAWSFSDRPDFSALVQETNLLASLLEGANAKPEEQVLFTDHRPGEEKALYYRFTVTAYSRYELLGNEYVAVIDSKIIVDKDSTRPGAENFWRRYLRKCSKTKRLPKPSVRFALPLTRSISECAKNGEIISSEMLVVLNDRWFSEGGLAEQLEVGIDVVSEGNDQPEYLSAGNDPIFTGTALGPVQTLPMKPAEYPRIDRSTSQPVMIIEPRGPVGLTFDFAAQTPRLKGAAFTIHLDKLENFISPSAPHRVNKLQPWSMAQIAVRRALRPELCEPGMNVETLCSEWTAKEWVQFLPALDSLIPITWRKAVSAANEITMIKNAASLNIPGTVFPKFNNIITPGSHQFFLIVTEKVYDIGGQPCENYLATYLIDQSATALQFIFNDGDEGGYFNGQEGYVRLMMVTSEEINGALSRERRKQNIWVRLFGESGNRSIEENKLPGFTSIQDDASAAMPMITERIPFKMQVQ